MPKVVSCLLIHEGKLLILKRSLKVRTYKEFWGAVAGYIEPDEEPYETAVKEIREEVGLGTDDIHLVKQGNPVTITDVYEGEQYEWIIHPFVFTVEKKEKMHIDWEHSEYQWIPPQNITQYQTVPHLREIVQRFLLN